MKKIIFSFIACLFIGTICAQPQYSPKAQIHKNQISLKAQRAKGSSQEWYIPATLQASDIDELEEYVKKSDFVFNLAGVNRPQNPEEFMKGNFGFASTLLDTLKKHGNTCPIMVSSSIQATCIGRYDSDYGRSKKAGEDLFFEYAKDIGAKVMVYRMRE